MNDREITAMLVLLSPALFTLLHEWVRAQRWGRGIGVAIHAVTVSMVSVSAALLVGWPRGWAELWVTRPLSLGLHADELIRLFLFALWFGLAMRMLVVARAEMGQYTGLDCRPRSATLTSRRGAPFSTSSWMFAYGVWGYGALATLIRSLSGGTDDVALPSVGTLALLALGLLLLSLGPAAARSSQHEAEPLDPHGSRELADAYAVHRSTKTSGYFWLTLALVTWTSMLAVVSPWIGESTGEVMVFIEAAALLIAIGGAWFGIHLAGDRMRIRRQLAELTADEQSA